ncbi:Mlp family lipoprotein [Borreliella bavariensis]|uniref:Mlp family lipoprotein n=1 Tax=Borreliella bavariensis TaxID=664662 RepID=UPI001C001D85|nr:Mlp family lipoprotein [Borreliella bavariensis]
MKIINILFCLFLIMLIGCNSNDNDTLKNNVEQQSKSRKKRDLSQEEVQKEKITLTADEEKMFNSLVTVFKYTIEKLNNEIQNCNNENESKCTSFFDWLTSIDIQKQKELANAFTTVYKFLESKRKSKSNGEDFNTYIKGAIDCKANKENRQGNQNNCNNDNNKYGDSQENEIEQYFRGVAGSIFSKNDNNNEKIYQCLKDELKNEENHYAGLTSNWNN